MERIHFSIFINAPREKVWDIMLGDKTYREWTEAFNPGNESYYEGEWKTGSDITFVGTDKEGNKGGMISRIKEARQPEFMSIQHLGMFDKGVKTMWTESETGPNGAFENYTLNEKDGGTELLIDLDTDVKYKEMFEGMWPKALQKLKDIAEK